MPEAQAREAAVVAVRGDPLAAGLDRECGEVGIGDEVAAAAGLGAEAGEDLPVPGSRREQGCVRLRSKRLAERDCLWQRRRLLEDRRMGDDPEEPAQDEIGDPVRLLGGDGPLQPAAVIGVSVGVLPVA